MTENKRFRLHITWSNLEKTEGVAELYDNGQPLLETECIEDARLLKTILNELNDENKELRMVIDGLKQQNQKLKGRLNDLGVEYYD